MSEDLRKCDGKPDTWERMSDKMFVCAATECEARHILQNFDEEPPWVRANFIQLGNPWEPLGQGYSRYEVVIRIDKARRLITTNAGIEYSFNEDGSIALVDTSHTTRGAIPYARVIKS